MQQSFKGNLWNKHTLVKVSIQCPSQTVWNDLTSLETVLEKAKFLCLVMHSQGSSSPRR